MPNFILQRAQKLTASIFWKCVTFGRYWSVATYRCAGDSAYQQQSTASTKGAAQQCTELFDEQSKEKDIFE